MANPTSGTRTAAHLLVGAAVAFLVAKTLGKGPGPALVSALLAIAAHEQFDAPVAKTMVAAGIQL